MAILRMFDGAIGKYKQAIALAEKHVGPNHEVAVKSDFIDLLAN